MTDLPKDIEDFTWTNDEAWQKRCASIARTMDALSNRTAPGWADSLITARTIAEPGNEEARVQIWEKISGFTGEASADDGHLNPGGEIPIAALYAYLSRTFSALADGESPYDVLKMFGQPGGKDISHKFFCNVIEVVAHLLADDDGQPKVYQAQKIVAEASGISFESIKTIWKRQQRKRKTRGQ